MTRPLALLLVLSLAACPAPPKPETVEATQVAPIDTALAQERVELEQEQTGFKAKTYLKVRRAALGGTCKALALAADQATKHEGAELPEPLREPAELAGRVAHLVAGREPPAEGQADWTLVATDLRSFTREPPPRLNLVLAGAYLALGHDGLALLELAAIDNDALATQGERTTCLALRALVYRMRGYPRLALGELAGLEQPQPSWGPELQASLRLLEAALLLEQGELAQGDVKLAEAIQAWPESPVAVFLTGERRAEAGEWEEAASSLEQAATGTRSEWLAERLGSRAREIRDTQGAPPPLLHDPDFMRRLTLAGLKDAATQSDVAAQLQDGVDTGRDLARRLLERVPGLGASGGGSD